MVRTKAEAAVKVSGAKAVRKAIVPTTFRNSSADINDGRIKAGGNSYHPRETPEWQKPITSFFGAPASKVKESDGSGGSKDS